MTPHQHRKHVETMSGFVGCVAQRRKSKQPGSMNSLIYVIQARTRDGCWDESACGDVTRFFTERQAQGAIASLRALGGEWAAAEYRISARRAWSLR